MVGSTSTHQQHRKLRKVLVRSGLLEERQFGLGDLDSSDFNPLGIIPSIPDNDIPTKGQRPGPNSIEPESIVTTTASRSSISLFTSPTSVLPATSVTPSSSSTRVSSPIPTTSHTPSTSATSTTPQFSQNSSPSLIASGTSSSSATSSPTANASNSSATSMSGNAIGGVVAGVIAVIALSVFGFFILRQRRKRRETTEQLLAVDPFVAGLPPQIEKELPPPPAQMAEQRMTFGEFYGRPGPASNAGGSPNYGTTQTYPLPSQYAYRPPQSPTYYYNPSGRSLTSPISPNSASPSSLVDPNPFADQPAGQNPISPFADPPSPIPSSEGHGSPVIMAPPPAAVKRTPSLTANGGNGADGFTRIPDPGYSPAMRSTFGASSTVLASPPPPPPPHVPNVSTAVVAQRQGREVGKTETVRPATVYNEEDAYDGI